MMLPNVANALLLSITLINPAMGGAVPRGADAADCDPPKPSPVRFGYLLPRAFSVLDVFGPIEILQALARQTHLELALLGRTLEPVTTQPVSASMNPFNSSFFPAVMPTHTYADDPPLDVLMIPGGAASRSPDLGPELDYIRKVFPRLQYLITVCTGAGIAAQSGVLDDRRATTNKAAWASITKMGPKVKWVSPARWVEDGNVWTSSGVTAGLDLLFEFIKQKFENGTAIAEAAAGSMEHIIDTNWRDDEGFGAKYHVPVQN